MIIGNYFLRSVFELWLVKLSCGAHQRCWSADPAWTPTAGSSQQRSAQTSNWPDRAAWRPPACFLSPVGKDREEEQEGGGRGEQKKAIEKTSAVIKRVWGKCVASAQSFLLPFYLHLTWMISWMAASARCRSLQAMMTLALRLARSMAVALPMPVFAPEWGGHRREDSLTSGITFCKIFTLFSSASCVLSTEKSYIRHMASVM